MPPEKTPRAPNTGEDVPTTVSLQDRWLHCSVCPAWWIERWLGASCRQGHLGVPHVIAKPEPSSSRAAFYRDYFDGGDFHRSEDRRPAFYRDFFDGPDFDGDAFPKEKRPRPRVNQRHGKREAVTRFDGLLAFLRGSVEGERKYSSALGHLPDGRDDRGRSPARRRARC